MRYKKLIICLSILALFIAITIFDAIKISPHKLTIREEIISSSKLDKSFDDFTIAYFSDLHFGTFINEEDLIKITETINSVDPDIVLFGGDLIDHYSSNGIKDTDRNLLIKYLKNINANTAKYAVLGNHDTSGGEEKRKNIEQILIESDFQILTNKNIQIHNGNEKYFNIIGIDTQLNGSPNINNAYNGITNENFNLVVTHCPDIFDELSKDYSDYVLAGHSHGGQVNIPFINYFFRPIGCKKYYYGKYKTNSSILDVTNGVGLTSKSIRIFADAEVVFYKLSSK